MQNITLLETIAKMGTEIIPDFPLFQSWSMAEI